MHDASEHSSPSYVGLERRGSGQEENSRCSPAAAQHRPFTLINIVSAGEDFASEEECIGVSVGLRSSALEIA